MSTGLSCPHCGHRKSDTVDTRTTDGSRTLRRRECQACKGRWTTAETLLDFKPRPDWDRVRDLAIEMSRSGLHRNDVRAKLNEMGHSVTFDRIRRWIPARMRVKNPWREGVSCDLEDQDLNGQKLPSWG